MKSFSPCSQGMRSGCLVLTVAVLTLCVLHVNSAKCKKYQGGTSTIPLVGIQVHGYACCNNCNDEDDSYTGHTYDGGSPNDYCDECGTSSWSGRRYLGDFQCPNCDSQNTCKSLCKIWKWPDCCWCWMSCFGGCCDNAISSGKRDITEVTFCGDGACEDAAETAESCPMDCCYQVNTVCILKTNQYTSQNVVGSLHAVLLAQETPPFPSLLLTAQHEAMNAHVAVALILAMMTIAFII